MTSYRTRMHAYRPALARAPSGALSASAIVKEFSFDASFESLSNQEQARVVQAGMTHTARIKTRYFPALKNVREGWILERASDSQRYFVTQNLELGDFSELLIRQLTK